MKLMNTHKNKFSCIIKEHHRLTTKLDKNISELNKKFCLFLKELLVYFKYWEIMANMVAQKGHE